MKRVCPNCKQELKREGHFVTPSLGEEGFFICKEMHEIDLMQALKDSLRATRTPSE